jgi:hypothetical protein
MDLEEVIRCLDNTIDTLDREVKAMRSLRSYMAHQLSSTRHPSNRPITSFTSS